MRITVITEGDGRIVGAIHGHQQDYQTLSGIQARPYPGPGQRFHEIELPDEIVPQRGASRDELVRFHEHLKAHFAQRPPTA